MIHIPLRRFQIQAMATSYDPCGHELAREHMLVALYPWVRRRINLLGAIVKKTVPYGRSQELNFRKYNEDRSEGIRFKQWRRRRINLLGAIAKKTVPYGRSQELNFRKYNEDRSEGIRFEQWRRRRMNNTPGSHCEEDGALWTVSGGRT